MNERADLWVRGISRHAYRRVSHAEMVSRSSFPRQKSGPSDAFTLKFHGTHRAAHMTCGNPGFALSDNKRTMQFS